MNSNYIRCEYVIFDCMHTDSHVDFNSELISNLAENNNSVLFAWDNSYDKLASNKLSIFKQKYLKIISTNKFFARVITSINTILNCFYIFTLKNNIKRKYIVIGYDLISLSFFSFLFPDGTYLIHHMQIDELNNNIKKLFFNRLKKKFIHVVMTDYIKNYLINVHNISSEYIIVIPHPLYIKNINSKTSSSTEKIFSALNYSIDESLINSIIEFDIKTSFFYKNNCRLIIKSKFYKYSSLGLDVFNGHLPKSKYEQYYENSDCILSLLNDSFKYRISGTIIDAISYNKPVIATSTNCSEYFKNIFPEGIFICNGFDSLIDRIIYLKNNSKINYYNEEDIFIYRKNYKSMVAQAFKFL